MKQMIRNLWFNYRSEVFFGVVLFTLTVLSYWLGAFIPESVFEKYVNPTEYICISAISLFGATLLFVHEDRNCSHALSSARLESNPASGKDSLST